MQSIPFQSTLAGGSEIGITTYVFKENGTLTVGNDTMTVTAGTVKFDVSLAAWSWCGDSGVNCRNSGEYTGNGNGAAIELDIDMYKVGDPEPQSSGDGKFALGGGQQLLVLNTYSEDAGDTWTEMPDGFPSLSGTTFTLQFPRWSGASVIYDPLVQYDDGSGGSTSATSATGPSPHQASATGASASLPCLLVLAVASLSLGWA